MRAWVSFGVALTTWGLGGSQAQPAPAITRIRSCSGVCDGTLSPEAIALQRERMLRLQSGLETLSPQQRQTLYLRAEGLQYQEIAAVMGVAISTVAEFS